MPNELNWFVADFLIGAIIWGIAGYNIGSLNMKDRMQEDAIVQGEEADQRKSQIFPRIGLDIDS